jgi:hypothetical protein
MNRCSICIYSRSSSSTETFTLVCVCGRIAATRAGPAGRTITECNFALGHIGQVAAARDDAIVCAAATSALLSIGCDPEGEPGNHFGSYMTSLRVVHSAITSKFLLYYYLVKHSVLRSSCTIGLP